MDFRTCPACKASVLEDDVEECPFCGASMSGKPSAKPKATPPKAPAGAAAKPAPTPKPAVASAKAASGSTPPKRPSASAPAPAEDDDNPFGVDAAALQKAAVPISPKATKTRTVEIKCPMCDTKGFIAPQHQGKDVKCANPNCTFPIFTAPKPKKEVVEDPNANQKGLSVGMLSGMAALVMAALGAGVYFLWLRPDPSQTGQEVTPVVEKKNIDMTGLVVKDGPSADNRKTASTPEEILKAALEDIVTASRQRENNANQPLGRRWAAEAFAVAKQPEKAREQLALSQSDAPYYRVEPLVRLFLSQKGTPEAASTLDEALKAAANLPQSGRHPIDAATALAAALVMADRQADASKLLARPVTDSRAIQSQFWIASTYGNMFDYDAVSRIPAFVGTSHPQWVAATWAVASLGEPDKALTWAKSAESVEIKEAGLAAWAARIAFDAESSTSAATRIEPGLADVGPSGRARAWANFAYGRMVKKDEAGARDGLARAEAALAEISPPAAMKTPSMGAIHGSAGKPRAGLPDTNGVHSAAIAAENIARIHALLNDKATAGQRLTTAVDFAQGIAPSVAETRNLVSRMESNRAAVEMELDKLLGLKGDFQKKFQNGNLYKKALGELNLEAQKRFDVIETILRDAVEAGLTAEAWSIMQARESAADAAQKEPFFTSDIPGFVALTAHAQGDKTTYAAISAVLPKDKIKINYLDEVAFRLDQAIAGGDLQPVLDRLKKVYSDPKYNQARLDHSVQRAFSRLGRNAKVLDALRMTREIPEASTREEALWLLAAASVQSKQAPALWRHVSEITVQRQMSATDRAAIDRGLIAGTALQTSSKPAS